MPIDNNKLKNLYDAMRHEGYDQSYDDFRSAFLGNNNYANRKDIYDTMSSGGYNLGKTYAEFMTSMQVAPQQANTNAAAQAAAAKSAPTQPEKGGWRPNAEQMAGYQRFTDGVLRTVKNGDDVMNRVNTRVARAKRPNQQKVNLGFNNKHSLLGGGSQVQHEGKKFDAAKGDFVDQYSTEAGNVYDNAYEADAEQYNINRNKRDAETLDMVADIERQIREQEELLEKTRKGSRGVKAPDNLWDALRYTMSHADGPRLDQEDIDEEAIKANITNLQNKRSLLLHGTSIGQKVGKSIDDQLAEVNRMIGDDIDNYYKRHPNGGPTLVSHDYHATGQYQINPYLDVAARSLEDAQEMFNEAGKSVGESGLTGFGKGVIRGFGSKLFDARTWDMGYTDLKGGLSLAEVLKKADEGKPLTVEQQKMLDAKATELACAAYFSGALGRGYKAGQVTAESIPFMLEFMLNPLSRTGMSAQAMLTRYALKRFGRKATMELGEDAAKKILYGDIRQLTKSVFDKGLSKGARGLAAKTLVSKAGARIAGDITGAAGMTATTGQGRVVADMLNRATGQVKFGVDTDGRVKYTGHDAPEESSLLTAYGKAFGSQFSENYSEFMGPYISYVGGMFANGLKKIGGKYLFDGLSSLRNRSAAAVMKLPFAPMVSDFIREATKSDWAKVIKGMQKRAHWDGTAEEYLEEVAGNMLNAILVGDNDFSTEEGRGVFNLSDNIDTFLGVSLMSGAMSVSSAAGYRTPAYRARKMVENADARGEKLLGSSLWGKFKSSFDAAQSEQDKQVILTALLQNSSLTDEGRGAALQYARGKQFQQAVADGTFREMEEDAEKGNEVERACRAEYAEGQNIDNVEEMRDAKTRYNVLLREALAVEPNAEIYSDPQFYEQSNPNATPEQKAAMHAYAEAKAQYEGVADRMKTDMADQQQKANEQVDRFKNQTDGLITRVRLRGSDAEFYVTSGHISLNNDGTINDAATSSNLTIVDGEGNQRFISRGDVVDVLAQNTPEETLEQLNDIIMNEAKAKADLIDGKLSFRAGDTFTILNNEGQEQKVTIAQDQSTMAMSAVIEGEQAAVPLTEDSMAKLQQMSDAYQESRFGKYRQEQQDAVANAENEATQEEATPTSPTASQEEASSPTEGRSYGYGESVSYVDGEGHTQEGVVHGKTPDGTYEVEFDNPPSGKNVVDEYTQEELDALVHPSSAEQTEEVAPSTEAPTEATAEEEPAEPQDNEVADSVPPTTEELVEMARGGNELAQYQLDQQGIQWKEPAEQTKDNAVAQSPKKDVPRDKDGNIIYDQVPVATTIEDLYDGALDDEEIGNFVQSQIDAANKAVDKITKKKPQISTNKSAYLEAKKKWEGELREAERKAQYWNDVKAEVEKITTPADARGWKDELSGEAARRQYRENSGNDHEAKSESEVAAEFMSQGHVKITPESYRKETGFGLDEQRKMVGKISKEGKTIDQLSEGLALFDEEYYNGRFFGGDSMVAKDALIAHLSSADARKGVSKVQSEAEAQFVENYEEQRERYYQERYHMSYEEYIEYSAQEMPELMRKYSNFDEQQFYNRYADEIEADLTRREQQSNNNNGTEENDSTREEQRHDRGNQVQSGQRTDDNSGSERGKDSEGEVRTRDEGSDEQESSSEESAVEGLREQEADIEQGEGANEEIKPIGKSRFGNIYDQFKGKIKEAFNFLMKHKSGDLLGVFHREGFGDVDLVWGSNERSEGLDHIIEKHIKAHNDFDSVEDAMTTIDDVIRNGSLNEAKSKWDKVIFEKDGYTVVVSLNVRDNQGNITDNNKKWIVTAFDGSHRQSNKKRESSSDATLVTPSTNEGGRAVAPDDDSSDGKGKEKVSSKQGSVGRKNVYGKNKVADWRTSVSSAMRQYETSPHDAHVAMCDIIDGMDSNALYGLMRMVLRTITSLDNENIRDGWKVDATHDLFDILKDRGFVVTKGSKGVAIGDVVIDKHGIIYVVEGVGKSRLDCGLYDVNDKTIIDHMTISRASVKYYYRDVNGKKDSVRLQKADVVDAELMAEEKPFNAVIEMLRKKFPDASMEALTAADRLLREQALPGERQKAIEAVAKALGLKVEWRDTMEKENGTFNPKTRTITIARDSQHALANTFGHEVTHAVRNLSEADYKNLKDAVRRLYSSEKEYNEAVQAYGDMYTGLDFDALEEELIADNIGFMIGGRNDMTQELASRMNHRVLWAIHDAMNKVRNALAKVLHIDSKKNGLLEALDSARATIRETMANAQRIAKEKGQGLSNESGSARQSLRTQDSASEFAEKHGVAADNVRQYAEGMKSGNLQKADWALSEIRRTMRVANRGMKLSEFGKLFRPIQNELAERYGDIERLRQEHIDAEMRERNLMEAARKKAEEEERNRQARLEELSLLGDAEVDKRYMDALKRGDEATAREMLDEAARRKGYGDAESDYQGEGAWAAPANPGYKSADERRADLENNTIFNVEDMALGYSAQPEDYFKYPKRYAQDTPHGRESTQSIQKAIEAVKRGEKDVKVKVYRAVPTSVKEGKLRNGDWVTPSKKYAEMHGNSRLEGKYRIIEDEVPVDELWWDGNDANEWGYDNGKGYKYKNVKNNRKSDDLVTRDDKGNVIPPSKRFNQRKADERYQKRTDGVKPSKAEVALRDALVERMRLSGMDVITDEAEGQRVLGMANGGDMRFEAARHKSEAARRRDEMLRAIDQAKAFISGKTEQQTRAERRERERKFREETKVLYDRVLAGNFDSVTLQLLDDFINKVTPNNYYGRPLSKRLSERTLRKVYERERTSSVDALFSRISESAVPADERTRPEAKRRIEEKKKELLKGWAIATGNWHTDVKDFTNANEPLGSGKDSDVYVSKDGNNVIKVSKGKESARKFRPDMDNVALFNTVFPASKYEIIGYGEIDGKFVRFLRQPIVDFTDSTPLSVEERVAYMERLGFRPMNDEKTAFTNGEIVASDIQGNNIVKDRDGNIRVIDADMRFHTKEFGGKYSYPAVETDTETAPNIREQRVYHGNGANGVRFFRTANGKAYGFTVGGKIYIDPRIATSETPVHEYAHLWATALKSANAKEWQNVVGLMKGTKVWDEVKALYPELKSDDEIADEVLATYSGRRGAERLREEQRRIAKGNGSVFEKAEAISALESVKQALKRFWKGVADFLHIHYTSAEEVADRVMKDLLDGVDPRSMMDGGRSLRPDTRINVVEGNTEHGFKNYAEAKDWAKEHIVHTYSSEETGGKGKIRISNTAIDKYLSQSAVDKSDSKDVHLSVLKVLPELIRESVDAEQHADYKKGEDGVRSADNGINPNVTIHRLYGAVRMDGRLYRVKVTLKEDLQNDNLAKKAYSYEATKIELLAGTLGKPEDDAPNTNNSITAAKLLNGVEKSYGGGKFFEDYNKIRKHFIGEQGAERADHAEEVTTRLDNLNVAREMEDAKKDAKAIKMATGWERGADGKWRYEIPDLKYFSNGYAGWKKARARQPWIQELDALSDKLFEGEDLSDSEMARFDELAAKESAFKAEFLNREKPHLADWVENDELFKAYPDLKRVNVVFTDQLPTNVGGSYNEREHTIVVNTNYVGDIDSVLAHEVQHAIQKIEGFAKGGNPETIRQRIEDYVGKNEEEAENTKSIIKSAFDLFGKASKLETIYPIMINSDVEWQRQTATDAYWDALNTIDNGFRHFETEVKNDYSQFKGMSPYEIARTGYHVKETIEELKRMSDEYLNSLTDDDRYLEELVDRYKKALESDSDAVLYTRLSGEVESRNVERRMGMSAEERRASLAAETEDVSREDQIFLFGEGGTSMKTSSDLNEMFGSRWLDEQTNDDGRHTTQVKSTINSYKKFGDWVKRDSNGRDVDVLDASSGLGLGTAWMRDNGFKVDDVEPFPSDSREAPTFSSYDEIDKKYDYIISNAVLNVIPDDWRAHVLHQMADKLKDGGKLVINVRGAESISKQGKEGETRITLDSPSEILVLRPNGSIKAYQKGFTKSELKEWCEKELGEGYSVEIANNKNAGGSYDTAVVVTKNNESGTVGVASEAGHPSWSAQALPSSVAKLEKNQEYAKDLAKLSGTLSKKVMGAHEFLFSVAKAFGFEEGNFNKSFYKDLGSSVGIRISDHSANPDNIINRNDNSNVYGLVIKLSNHRFKSRKDANYLEYVYYPDKLTQERQQEIVGGLEKFLETGDYAQLPSPDRVNRSGVFDRRNDIDLESSDVKQSRRGTPNLNPDHLAQAIYEQSVNGFKFDLDEAWHDSLLSVKRLQEAISETRGVPIRDFENVYWHAVTLSSVNAAEMEQLMNLRIQPFIEAVQDICKKHDLTQEDIEVYLNCKHGLERNEAMARRDAEKQANEEFKDELRKAERAAAKDPLDQDAADALDDVKQRMNDREEELYFENREKDYSGLTDIFDPKDKVTGDRLDLTVSELEDKAKKCVDDFENKVGVVDVTKLWDNIHELNNYSLRKSYLSGLISKSQYDSVKQMYQWYVPLRGFNEEVAGDVYTYVTRGETRTQQLLKEAKGRTSRAGDILATMMNMANSAVNQGNRNLMKQKILNLALNAKSPLLSVSSTWYQTDANGFDVPIEPPINDQMTPSEQKDAIEQWEDTMEMLAKQGKVHRMSDNLRLNLRTQKWQADEHCIRVQRGGKEYCVWVNGNPRAAQALNDRLGNQVTKPYKATETILDKAEDLFTDGFIKIFRYMAQSVTSLNPEFVISNFQRDLASASLVSTGKYGVGYTKDFLVNVKRLGVLTGTMSHKKEYRNAAGIYTLYNKYKSGTLDNNNEMERYFAEFMQHGGETGYTQSLSIKDYQSRIQSALGDKGFVKWSKNAGHAVADFVEMANRGVENTCRFAAYMTSRQHGKSVLQAIVDAKEASTNFNLHGAGGFGNAWLRKSIIFINPAVQSIVQYCQLTAKHPKAMLSMLGGTILLGAAMAFACARMVAPGGGDPDSNYWDLSDYVRHNYIVIPSGNGNWTRIALPPEIRAVYGLGVIAMEAAMGRMNHSSIPAAIGDQLMQFSPVAFLDPRNFFNRSDSDHSVGKTLIKAFTPTLASPIADAYIWDEDFMGRQITGKNDFNDDKPEFQRVSYDTLPQLVSFSRWLNNISGGNDYKKGWVNINPSAAGYVASQYIGGPLQFVTKIGKTVAMITYEDLRDMRNVPFLSRFMTSTDNDYGRNQVSNAEFKYWSAIADDVRTQIRGFEKEIESGDTKNLDDYKRLVSSKEYEMYQMIDYMDWLKDIRELNQKRKEETTQDAQKQVTLEIYEVRRKMAECLNKAEEMGVYLDMSQLNLELANAKTTEERAAIQAKINEKRKENLKKIGAIE